MSRVFAKRIEETARERTARHLYAATARRLPRHYRVVREPQPGVWYDVADIATGKCGQCRLNDDGTWHQAPLGEEPVILAHCPPKRAEVPLADEINELAACVFDFGRIAKGPGLTKTAHATLRFEKQGGFTGTVRVIPGQKAPGFAIEIRGLNQKQVQKLGRFLSRLR